MARPSTWPVAIWASCLLAGGAAANEVLPYRLAVESDRVSLHAVNADMVKVIEDLGRRMEFEVVAQGVADYQVSDDFEQLPVREAIARICESAGYVEVPDPQTGGIMRLVLTPGKSRGANRLEGRRDPMPHRPRQMAEPVEIPEPVVEPEPVIEQPPIEGPQPDEPPIEPEPEDD